MIGVTYVNGDNRIMEDRLEVTNDGVGSDIIGCPSQSPAVSSTRKPSILRKQMLRRTTNRTRKRPPESVGASQADGDHSVATAETIEDDSDCAALMVEPNTIPQISSRSKEDQPLDQVMALRLMAEFELMNGARINKNDASNDGDEANCSLDISITESDDGISGVETTLIEENDASKDGDDPNRSLDISIIESDDGVSGVETTLIEEDEWIAESDV